ncbi:MAG: dTMP kinase [Acidimicrobiales bacterium]
MALIAFEGGDASGKSTQARILAERLGALLTHEPGATPAGAELRRVALDPAFDLVPRAEALVMAADRAQHVAKVIAPALAAGRHVVTDRYLYSSLAYQGHGRQLPVEEVLALSRFAGAPEADLVVLLAVAPATRATRLGHDLDRIEAGGVALHERIDSGFRILAAGDPERWLIVSALGGVEEVAARIWDGVAPRLSR